jgi:hypothetical protein
VPETKGGSQCCRFSTFFSGHPARHGLVCRALLVPREATFRKHTMMECGAQYNQSEIITKTKMILLKNGGMAYIYNQIGLNVKSKWHKIRSLVVKMAQSFDIRVSNPVEILENHNDVQQWRPSVSLGEV